MKSEPQWAPFTDRLLPIAHSSSLDIHRVATIPGIRRLGAGLAAALLRRGRTFRHLHQDQDPAENGSSLSLQPALVSFCPAHSSTTWPKIRDIGVFAINVLAGDQIDTSSAFSRSGTDKFAGVRWQPGPNGSPIIDGVLAWAECRLWAEYAGGDHTIVAAEVTDLQSTPSKDPLLYYRGRYHLASPADSALR
ncbi:flavin reductase family protein [Rhodococcus sp. KBS0724]|nr:flavin reductase family protein [Rhodococcus sp. KBS0724]